MLKSTSRPLVKALRGIMLCSILGASIHALANDQQSQHYQIAAGQLGQTLSNFAMQSGIALSFDPTLTQGLNSKGLNGQYNLQQGFNELLKGTQLHLVKRSDGSWTIEKKTQIKTTTSSHQSNDIAVLPTLTVNSQQSATTENTQSFATQNATVFRGISRLKDIPQPVTVITRDYMDTRGLLDLHAVMQNTPGVNVDYTDSERVNYYSRGHQIDVLQIDGLTMSQDGSLFIQPDTAVLDRIEILRGASGSLRGAGNPSAAVNMVRKRPTKDFQSNLEFSVGSWDRRRVSADVSTPLNSSGSVRARVIGVIDDKEFFQKARTEKKDVLYAVIEADLTNKTTATLSFQHTDIDATGAWGNLPSNFDGSSLNLARNTYLGTDWNQWNRYNQQTYFALEHHFDNDWKINLDASHIKQRMKQDNDYGFLQSYFTRSSSTNPYLFTVTTSAYDGGKRDQDNINLSANGSYSLFGRQHEALIGGEWRRIKEVGSKGYYNINKLTNVDIRTWDPSNSYPQPTYADITSGTAYQAADSHTTQKAIYARTRVSITDPLNLLLGGRLNWWEYDRLGSTNSDYKVSQEFTPFVGLTYDITPEVTAYTSYTSIFSPQQAYNSSGELLKPVRGKDYELGLKSSWLNDQLNASLSLFNIENEGKAIDDLSSSNPCTPYYTSGYCKIADGLTKSKGWEIEVAGKITANWQIMASYTNTHTKYVKDSSSANQGQPLRSIDPRHIGNLFSSYKFSSGIFDGLTIGAGLQARSDSYVTSGTVTARQGGYTVYNAMLGYEFTPNLSARFNFNNIFDKVYYAKYGATGINDYYGDPRNLNFTVQVKF
ncbi:hypothetical protein BJI46_02275 [Acinetobacter qingfengensis]|uniref:Secretin/TonB short N-terminal domain-containing protein n=2 Tax=Acinetobacter qingfengensis TaxID=1262585 RepID=A0A1E7RD07_9GAMM|nr:hypothetical protein BJI46_02275 [Acinetobacter qingfengensis]